MKVIEKALMSSQQKLLSYLGVEFLSMKDIQDMSKNLAVQIMKKYNADLVVGIARGGTYPGYCIAKEMQLPYTTMDISRKKRYIGRIETDQILLLPKLLKKSQEKPSVITPFNYKFSTKKILIVDDDCGSMKTLTLAKSHLKEKGLESKTSVILNCEGGTPDFFEDWQRPLSKLIHGKLRFPWSQYSPYFNDYQKWLKNNF